MMKKELIKDLDDLNRCLIALKKDYNHGYKKIMLQWEERRKKLKELLEFASILQV